jgi:PilZ domain
MPDLTHSRRWSRYQADFPIRITPSRRASKIAVPGRVITISEGGMAVQANVYFEAGDLMETEFQMPQTVRVIGLVRSRAGFSFGLEFLNPLLPEYAEMAEPWPVGREAVTEPGKPETPPIHSLPSPNRVFAALHQTDLQIRQVAKEIQALRAAAILLAEAEKKDPVSRVAYSTYIL